MEKKKIFNILNSRIYITIVDIVYYKMIWKKFKS